VTEQPWTTLWDTLLINRGWYMDKEWIPAFAESTPRIEKKYSGGEGRKAAGRTD